MRDPLDATRWRRVRELARELDGLDPAAREARLAALDDPPEVVRDVRRVIADDTAVPDAFLASEILALGRANPAPEVGARVGPFRLERRIAAGGMGTVFEAIQDAPHRTVALKLLSAGLPTERARRRFEFEAEILGHLSHPGIAQVYGSGVHRGDTGFEVPWFAMELVTGARDVLTFARGERLDTDARLALFCEIAAAVEHGHRRGVLHRDLKPSNLLVGEDGRPKVIDFGVARATDAGLETTSQLTSSGEILGTVRYMSPEQFEGQPDAIDVRSDVYALGVVLYELLCDGPPFELDDLSIFKAARVVREEPPRRPREARPELARELEWILLRALEKEPERRYGSVSELREDVERHLSDEPVRAGPPSGLYRARKFVHRHRVPVGAAAAVALALVIGSMVAGFGLVRANENLARVELEAGRTARVNRFLRDLFLAVAPLQDGRDVRVADLLDRARDSLALSFEEDDAVRASLQDALAGAYFELGIYDDARALVVPALAFESARLGPGAPLVLDLERKLHESNFNAGIFDGVEENMRDLLARCEGELGEQDPITMGCRSGLGHLLWELNRPSEAAEVLRADLAIRERFHPNDHRTLGRKRSFLAFVLVKTGAFEESEALAEEACEELRLAVGEDDLTTLYARGNLAKIWQSGGRHVKARDVFITLADALRAPLGEDHPHWLTNGAQLAESEFFLRNHAEAERIGRKVLAGRRRGNIAPHPDIASAVSFLATVLQAQNELEEAEELYEEALEQREALFGPDDPKTVACLMNLARIRLASGEHDGLAADFEDVIDRSLRNGGPVTTLTMTACSSLGKLHMTLGDNAAAERAFARAVDFSLEGLPPDHPHQLDYRNFHARALVLLDRDDEAEKILHELIAKMEPERPADDPGLGFARQSLAMLEE